jgi:hypothetical protein
MPGSIIVSYLGMTGFAATATAFAINMVASAILAKQFTPASNQNSTLGDLSNPGSRAQVPPAGDNKLPVVYGSAYVGGIVTDLSITSDYQNLYYCLALCEVTNTETGGSPDTITFGNAYWGGKRVVFQANGYTVASLLDESTGLYDTSVDGKLEFYFYRNGSTNPTNSAFFAYGTQVMGNTNLVYKWDSTKAMTNCAFVIVKIRYSQSANLTGIQQTRFQVTNSRYAPGDCFLDYLTSTRYGAAIPTANVDTTSLTALNVYCAQSFSYITYNSAGAAQARFRFDGMLDTQQPIMTNLQYMATCCDCLLRYNEITSTWGVIVQSPTYTVAMALNDSNIIGAISVTPLDIASSFNIAEVKFPDSTAQDSFNSATFNLAVVNPSLLYPNEPVNKQSISLPLVNNDVRAQYLANRFLETCREDLQIQLTIGYVGLQLEAGDIVSITNDNYGWTGKLFRISKVTENYGSDGTITATLMLTEYNSTVYDDKNITQFTPSPNTGLASPLTFGTIPTPSVAANYPNDANPYFIVNTTTSSAGIVDYVELWYSAYSNPTTAQRIFAGTTAIASDGNPYDPNTALTVTLSDIAAGNWYFFTRMVNGLGSSPYSSASPIFQWRPTTFTYANQYLVVAYGNDLVGTGISSSPTGKNYYGLYNSTSTTFSSNPANYTWYLAQPTFGTANKLCYINRTGRKFSFGTAPAVYAASTAAYVPASTFDDSIWSALPDGTNYIDLDVRTGQLTRTGTTSVGSGQIAITNNPNGTLVGSLAQFLNFGGPSTYTTNIAQLTIDIYGRVVGVTPPDNFYYTSEQFTATASQTIFTPTARQAGYITGMDLVFKNGVLLDTTEYTENNTTVTLGTACTVGDRITITSMRSVASGNFYQDSGIDYSSGTGTTTLTYTNLPHFTIFAGDILTFGNTLGTTTITAGSFVIGTTYQITALGSTPTNFVAIGAASNTVGVVFKATGAGTGNGTAVTAPAEFTVSTINYVTKQIVFTAAFTASAGNAVYRKIASGSTYRSFSRFTNTLTAASTFTPTTFQYVSGSELLFLNGTIVNDQDYDLVGNTINNFPATASGNLTTIQWSPNLSGVPNGLPTSVTTYTINGVPLYSYSYTAAYFDLYGNGCLYVQGTDYTTGAGSYTLVPTPNNNTTILVQQTFDAVGAA